LGYWNSSMSEVMSFWLRLGSRAFRTAFDQREVLDALRREVGRQLAHRDTPQLLVVGLEEVLVQPPAEAGHDPALERRLVLGRPHP